MTYSEALKFLYDALPMFHRIGQEAFRPGLENIRKLCAIFGHPQNKFPTIHIGGTNGKGSTSHLLASILQSAGYKTGLYTSPHLKNFTERIKVNGKEVAKDFVLDFIEKNKALILEVKPSFFEITVVMAFLYFESEKVDIAVIEVGLGGRLDSTNIINPLVSVITNISLDHQNILGNSYEEIAAEKAGIIKEKTPIVISERQENVENIFIETAKQRSAALYFASDNFKLGTSNEGGKHIFNVSGKNSALYNLEIGLTGIYQTKNILGVLQTVDILQERGFYIDEKALREGIKNVCEITAFMGRWQTLQSQPTVIADTGHNEAGIKEILNQLKYLKYKNLRWVFGVVKDKDVDVILDLLPQDAYYYFCQADIPRAMDCELLLDAAQRKGLTGEAIGKVQDALKKAIESSHIEDLVLVGGSTFVVAEAL